MNVLLILTDQWRGDCLGIEGHPDVLTPNIDTLAAYGIRYVNAYSACPTCIPARAAIHTGMSQEKHGRVGYRDGVSWDYAHTLAGEFSAAGYYSKCCGKMHVHPERRLLGYHSIDLHDGYLHYYRGAKVPHAEHQCVCDDYIHDLKKALGADADITDTGIDCNSWLARPWIYDEKLHPTTWATDRAIDFLRRRDRDMPFFLTVSYVRPHPPLDAPKTFFDMYDPDRLTLPEIGDWEENCHRSGKNDGYVISSDSAPNSKRQLALTMQGYYASITHVDFEVGRIIEALFAEGVSDDTLVMFASDHGEMLGEHGFWRKSLPFDGSARVPLIIGGNYRGKPAPSVRHEVAELRDIMPTLLTAAKIAVPDCCDGVDLLSDVPKLREYIHGEHIDGSLSNHYIITERDKYVWLSQKDTDAELYFDHSHDYRGDGSRISLELHNGANDIENAGRVKQLRNILIRELEWREEEYVNKKDGSLVAHRPCYANLKVTKK